MASPSDSYFEFWSSCYTTIPGGASWQLTEVNPNLFKYHDLLFPRGKKGNVFLPMCGKTKDLMWLHSQGHRVVGVEFVQTAVEEFAAENGQTFTVQEKGGFQVYTNADGRIEIWKGDIFKLDPRVICEGGEGFDAIWDRGALVAVPLSTWDKYAQLMKSLINKTTGVYLLNGIERGEEGYKGAPHNVPLFHVNRLYSDQFDIKVLQIQYNEYKNVHLEAAGIEALPLLGIMLLMTPKNGAVNQD